MKKQRILFSVTNDLNYDQRMIRICGSLAKAGYEVQLIGREKRHSKPLIEQAFTQKRFPCFFQRGKFFYLEYNCRLFLYLLFASTDAFCAIDLDTILPVFLVGKLRRKKIIYDAHEYFTETPEVARRPLIKRVWETLAEFCVPRIRHAYTVGGELQKILSERYRTSFALIRNVPFAKAWPTAAKAAPPVILYQGVLNEGRGISEALEAMQDLPEAQLWLLGEGDLSQSLREKCQDLGLETRVQFKGYIPPAQLRAYTEQATIGLNLLENRSLNYYYSLANKAFDYIQSGLPALHMDFPEYQRLNQPRPVGLLLEELSPSAIATALRKLLNEEAAYAELRANCKLAAQSLVWEEEEKVLLEFYRKVFLE